MAIGGTMMTASGLDGLLRKSENPADPDIRALACILIHRCSHAEAPHRRALGLDGPEVRALVMRYFPMAVSGWAAGECFRRHVLGLDAASESCCGGEGDEVAAYGRFSVSLLEQEEQDLCRLFLTHAAATGLWPVVFARLIARACMEPEHLWMSLGLENRGQLTAILECHFPALVAKNERDMRWKKFFYKLLCDIEKVWTCTASSCEICPHHPECYAPEL